MDNLLRDSRAREGAQDRRIHDMQEGLARFLERCDPAHLAAARRYESPCAPVMSTPFMPSGAPPMLDIGRKSGESSGFPNRPSCKPADRDDHGTARGLRIPSRATIASI